MNNSDDFYYGSKFYEGSSEDASRSDGSISGQDRFSVVAVKRLRQERCEYYYCITRITGQLNPAV